MICMIYLIAMILKNQDNHKNQGSDNSRKYENDILLPVCRNPSTPPATAGTPQEGN